MSHELPRSKCPRCVRWRSALRKTRCGRLALFAEFVAVGNLACERAADSEAAAVAASTVTATMSSGSPACAAGGAAGCAEAEVCVSSRGRGYCSLVFANGMDLWRGVESARGRYVWVREVTIEPGPRTCTSVACPSAKGSANGCCNTCSAEGKPKHTGFRVMQVNTGPAFRCDFRECEQPVCFSETTRYELIGRVSADGHRLTDVDLLPLAD